MPVIITKLCCNCILGQGLGYLRLMPPAAALIPIMLLQTVGLSKTNLSGKPWQLTRLIILPDIIGQFAKNGHQQDDFANNQNGQMINAWVS